MRVRGDDRRYLAHCRANAQAPGAFLTASNQTPAAAPLLAEIQQFLREQVLPLEPAFLAGGFARVEAELQAVRERARKGGLWIPTMAREYGGRDLALRAFAPLSEALGYSPLGHFALNSQAPDIGNMELLAQHGNDEQRRRFLHPLARGEVRSCFTMTEPGYAGSNPTLMGTTAVADGDHYVINGHKWFATGADGAAFAIAMALTDPAADDPHKRASLFIVPTDTPGYIHVRRIPVMGDEGEGPFSHSEIRYEDCRVPAANLVGDPGAGFRLAQQRLGPGRIHHCMRWIGICERAFGLMCARAADREIAPGRTLASRQTVQNWIAESRADIDAARLLVLDTAQRIDDDGAAAVRREISQIKFHVARVMLTTLDRAIQVHGAAGLTDETLLSHWFRHERGARVYDGPDEVHKSLVARLVLRAYANG